MWLYVLLIWRAFVDRLLRRKQEFSELWNLGLERDPQQVSREWLDGIARIRSNDP